MAIRIERLDPSMARDLDDAADALTTYWREVLGPDEPATPAAEIRERLRLGRDDIAATLLLARDGDRTVGLTCLDIRNGFGNEHMAWLEELYVLADHRRHGVGRALLDENIAIARAAERTLLIGGYNEGNDGGAGFVAALKMRIANSERQNRVRVTDLDRALLNAWNHPADGYSLVQFDGRCPDDLIDQFARIQKVMNDAPRTESLGDFVMTAEHRRAAEAELEKWGTDYWFAGARHDESGDIAGFSELVFRSYKPWLVEQGDTGVDPAHRGKGIGRWLKAVNALRVLDEKPDARVIETWNDGSNKWMLDINTAMGFRPVVTWIEAELDL